ncbi:hypothetical protein PMZ80_005893 [Knufia obscura]|uniref:Uncharacterized protein n=2 Tax=Knufia TaxID=430999 RepID=A0AAN8EMA9_9EURO|nr:hypothetical protein PMZ80_005893 [Knufia obscura]KAK5954563.1 hypothetical protein OHC33_004285 [Knufia fluminis]
MSDDEYYYDPDYEDFHEMLYDADASPDLADDLAEHAMYSPLWQDNPAEELRDYFSDWEYYSDDYFDDDPNLLNGVAKTGDGQKSGGQLITPAKRGRKRKLSEAREHPKLEKRELAALTACLQGTVWKSRSPEPGVSYQTGVDSPVALQLSEEIMRSAYSRRRGFGKGRVKRDESWANDLSLADMGLKAERTVSMHEQPEGDSEEDDVQVDQDAVDDEESFGDEEAVEAEAVLEEPYRVDVQSELAPLDSVVVQEEIDNGRTPRKRRKLSVSARKTRDTTALPTPDGSLDIDASNNAMVEGPQEQEIPVKRGRGRPKKSETISKAPEVEDNKELKPKVGPGRKRKLSVSSATGPTASSRAKRVDTKQDTAESKPAVTTAAATRPTPSRKK